MNRTSLWYSVLALVYGVAIAACHGKTLSMPVDIAHDFGISVAQASWVVSSVAFVAAVAAPVVGWLVDRWGERRSLAQGLLVAAVAGFLVSQTSHFGVLISLRVIEGAGYILVVLAALSLLIRSNQGPRRVRALALWSVASPTGGALAVLLAAPLVAEDRWRLVFQAHAAILAIGLLFIPFVPRRDGAVKRPDIRIGAVFGIYRSRSVIRLSVALGLLCILDLGLATASQSYFIARRGVAPVLIGQTFLASVILMIASSYVCGRVLSHKGREHLVALTGCVIASIGGIIVFLPWVAVPVALGVSVLSSVGNGIQMAWLISRIPHVAPSEDLMGSTGGIVSQMLYIGMFVGPPVVLTLLDDAPLFVFAAVIVAINVLPLVLARGIGGQGDQGAVCAQGVPAKV